MGMRTGPSEPGESDTDHKARRALAANADRLGPERVALAERLVALGQGQLFVKWPHAPSEAEAEGMLALADALARCDAACAGGVEGYTATARALLAESGVATRRIESYQLLVRDGALHFRPPPEEPAAAAAAAPPAASAAAAAAAPPAPQEKPVAAPRKPAKRADMLNGRCWGKFWSTYTAKDKTGRVIQYGSKALQYYMRLRDPDSVWADTLDTMASNVSKGRALFRLFRWVDDAYKLLDTVRGSTGGALQLCSVLNVAAKTLFIVNNNVYWMMTWKLAGPGAGWLTFTTAKAVKLFNARLRMFEILTGLLTQLLVRANLAPRRPVAQASDARAGPQTIRRCNKLLSPPAAIGEGDEQRQLAARAKRRSAGFRTAVYLLNTITYGDLSGFHMAVFGRTISEGCATATNRTQ